MDLVPRLLLPLAGPDTFTEEENDSLPVDLQFLPDDKIREPVTEIRKLVLEALMQVWYFSPSFSHSYLVYKVLCDMRFKGGITEDKHKITFYVCMCVCMCVLQGRGWAFVFKENYFDEMIILDC